MDPTIFVSMGVFFVILIALVLIRLKSNKFEIRATDLVVAVLPVVIFLLLTGKIQKLEMGELKIEMAFVKASISAINAQVSQLTGLPSEPLQIDPKRGVEDIPRLIEKKTEGLLFRVGYGEYYGSAIQDYLNELIKYPYLKYIVLENRDGTFFGMADARALATLLSSARPPPPYSADNIANWLIRSDTSSLKRLPGFEGSDMAVSQTTDKKQTLQMMEKLNVENLPVIDKEKRFVGIVNRSRLTASLILDVANELKK